MKKLLLIIIVVFASYFAQSQYLYLTNSITQFGYTVPPNVYVFDVDQEKWFLVTVEQAPTSTINSAISALQGHYVDTGGGGTPVTSTGGNFVNFTGTTSSSATANADSLTLAFTRSDHIFIRKGTYSMGTITIPSDKAIKFERGARFDVTGTLTNSGLIDAGRYDIFTISSIGNIVIGSTAIVDEVYPEWFVVDGVDDNLQIQACLDLFSRVDLQKGKRYAVGNQIAPPINSDIYGNFANLRIQDDFPDNESVFLWNQPVCAIYDLSINIPNYKERGGTKADAYTGWVLKSDIDYNNSRGREYRRPFVLRNVRIQENGAYIAQEDWTPDTRYHGFFVGAGKAAELGYSSESYFGEVYNLYIGYGYDTAVFCSGDQSVDDNNNSHMNSWYFQDCKLDYGIRHLVIDSTSRGHYFGGLMCQTYYTTVPQPYMEHPALDIYSFGNRIDVRFEDEQNQDSLIVFRDGSYKNTIRTDNPSIKDYVRDDNTNIVKKRQNSVTPNSWFKTDGAGNMLPIIPLTHWTFANGISVEAESNYSAPQNVEVYNAIPAFYQREVASTQYAHQLNKFKAKGSNDALFGTGNQFGGYLSFNIGGTTTDINIANMFWRKSDNSNAGDNKGQFLMSVSGTEAFQLDWRGQAQFFNAIISTPIAATPTNVTEGMLWFDDANNTFNVYIGGQEYVVDMTAKP